MNKFKEWVVIGGRRLGVACFVASSTTHHECLPIVSEALVEGRCTAVTQDVFANVGGKPDEHNCILLHSLRAQKLFHSRCGPDRVAYVSALHTGVRRFLCRPPPFPALFPVAFGHFADFFTVLFAYGFLGIHMLHCPPRSWQSADLGLQAHIQGTLPNLFHLRLQCCNRLRVGTAAIQLATAICNLCR